MSKLQVNDIVDKDDVSAPGFSKGAVITGVCTATTFVGALTGNVTGLVHGVDIRNIEPNTAGFDFGSLSNDVRGLSDWLIYQTDIDFGSHLSPDPRNFDAGVLT